FRFATIKFPIPVFLRDSARSGLAIGQDRCAPVLFPTPRHRRPLMASFRKLHLAALPILFLVAWAQPAKAHDGEEYMKMVMGGFYPDYYHATNPDVGPVYGRTPQGAFRHWKEFGIEEMRAPSPFFEPKYYQGRYPDLSHMNGDQ